MISRLLTLALFLVLSFDVEARRNGSAPLRTAKRETFIANPYSPYSYYTGETLQLQQSWGPNNFWSGFYFISNAQIADVIDGQMVYLDGQDAFDQGLAYTTANSVILKVDNTSTLDWGAGRPSVRLNSVDQFKMGSLLIADFAHVPTGLTTWPAFWTVGENWPQDGEIDIYEGANNQPLNWYSIHTSGGCQLNEKLIATGSIRSSDCSGWAPGNEGCSFYDGQAQSYGTGLNSQGGATFAVFFDYGSVSIWRFSYKSWQTQGDSIDMSTWGNPVAVFTSKNGCNIQDNFNSQTIVLNIGICGTLAEGTWDDYGPGDGSVCADYVQNPRTYDDAYFDISNIRVYSNNNN